MSKIAHWPSTNRLSCPNQSTSYSSSLSMYKSTAEKKPSARCKTANCCCIFKPLKQQLSAFKLFLAVGRRCAAALLPRLFGKNPRSHHKGATGRVRTGDQRLPVLCHCQLGQDIPNFSRKKFVSLSLSNSSHWHRSEPPGGWDWSPIPRIQVAVFRAIESQLETANFKLTSAPGRAPRLLWRPSRRCYHKRLLTSVTGNLNETSTASCSSR